MVDDESLHTCARRVGYPGPWDYTPNLDSWIKRPNGDYTCSFCGGLHPMQFHDLLTVVVDPYSKPYISVSDKEEKIYLNDRGVPNTELGAIKFYRWHEDHEAIQENYELYLTEFNMALQASNTKMMFESERHKQELRKRWS